MIYLLATKAQANKLNGTYGNDCVLQFTEVKEGYIVGRNVLEDPNFEEIKEQLIKLKQIEINP
jgi:hypothetical protein